MSLEITAIFILCTAMAVVLSAYDRKVRELNKLNNISNYIERRLNEEADNFRIALETETIGTQQAVAKKINDKYARLEQELEEYKKHRWEEIESKLAEIIKQVSQKVLGKSLGVQEHSDLIIQALEEAKRKNVI